MTNDHAKWEPRNPFLFSGQIRKSTQDRTLEAWSWNTDLISSRIVWDQNIWGRFVSKGWHPWVALYLSCLICVVLCWVELCGWVKSQQNATLSEVTGTSWDVVRSDIRYKICVAWAPTDVEHEECLSSSGARNSWCRTACLVSSAQCPIHLHRHLLVVLHICFCFHWDTTLSVHRLDHFNSTLS